MKTFVSTNHLKSYKTWAIYQLSYSKNSCQHTIFPEYPKVAQLFKKLSSMTADEHHLQQQLISDVLTHFTSPCAFLTCRLEGSLYTSTPLWKHCTAIFLTLVRIFTTVFCKYREFTFLMIRWIFSDTVAVQRLFVVE